MSQCEYIYFFFFVFRCELFSSVIGSVFFLFAFVSALLLAPLVDRMFV